MKYPKIVFKLKGLRNARWERDTLNADAFGILLLKNNTSPITFPITIKYLRNARKKYDRKPGDFITLKGQLSLSRGAFGINPGSMLDVIQDRIIINVTLVGCSSEKRPLLPSRLFI
jgi:polyisoprenoid-binding protein YceI